MNNTKAKRLALICIVLLGALTWSNSVTTEYTGYDDVKLIVNNEKIHEGPIKTLMFYGNIVSDSHNIAWTNYPTVIYRPLEWFGSSLGYMLWGAKGWMFHIFFNIFYHIANAILIFFILLKLLEGKEALQAIETNSSKKKVKNFKTSHKKQEESKKEEEQQTHLVPRILLAAIISCIWIVHPLHNEAVNMLTSGVGFLWATFFGLSAIAINLYIKDLEKPLNLALFILSWLFYYASFCGSEMALIGPVVLTIIFVYRKLLYNKDILWLRVIWGFSSIFAYLKYRAHIVSEHHQLFSPQLISELPERIFVLAPQVFMHYFKLIFYPATLSIDEHHEVVLANTGEPYHLISAFVFFGLIAIGAIYLYRGINSSSQDEFYNKQNRMLIGGSLLIAFIGIGIALNILPLYCLARDRYTYVLVFGIIAAIVFGLYHHLYPKQDELSEEEYDLGSFVGRNSRNQALALCFALAVTGFGIRSFAKCNDWKNGEAFWYHVINTVDDIGAKQVWRSRLMDYYKDPGTKTFKANPDIQNKIIRDFGNFVLDNRLNEEGVVQRIKEEDKRNYIKHKYGYSGAKTIASGLFFSGTEELKAGQEKRGLANFALAHKYYPEQFQVNINLVMMHHKKNTEVENYLLNIMDKEAEHNPFLAKGLMDTLNLLKHPRYLEFAKKYHELNPNTQVFDTYLYNAAMYASDFPTAYEACKRIVKKYHNNDTFDKFIKLYEAGIYNEDNLKRIIAAQKEKQKTQQQ